MLMDYDDIVDVVDDAVFVGGEDQRQKYWALQESSSSVMGWASTLWVPGRAMKPSSLAAITASGHTVPSSPDKNNH